jgi:conjugal transfer/entry exclusion protein
MVKNKHLLVGVATASFATVLICLLLLVRENKNGHDLVEMQERGSKYSQETRKNLQDLTSDIHEHGTKYSQETRKNLQELENKKVTQLFSDLGKVIHLQHFESEKRDKEISSLKAENKRFQQELAAQKQEGDKREKEMNDLKAENKRFQEELSTGNGIKKRIDDLEKALKKLSPDLPNGD